MFQRFACKTCFWLGQPHFILNCQNCFDDDDICKTGYLTDDKMGDDKDDDDSAKKQRVPKFLV